MHGFPLSPLYWKIVHRKAILGMVYVVSTCPALPCYTFTRPRGPRQFRGGCLDRQVGAAQGTHEAAEQVDGGSGHRVGPRGGARRQEWAIVLLSGDKRASVCFSSKKVVLISKTMH